MPLGLPSQRIDVLVQITGVDFEKRMARPRRTGARRLLVANKRSNVRAQDLDDVTLLRISPDEH